MDNFGSLKKPKISATAIRVFKVALRNKSKIVPAKIGGNKVDDRIIKSFLWGGFMSGEQPPGRQYLTPAGIKAFKDFMEKDIKMELEGFGL